MKELAFALSLSFILCSLALADEPEMFLLGPGGNPGFDAVVLWTDNPDFAASVGSSEAIAGYALVGEIANDFIIEQSATVMMMTWWGAYWNGFDGTTTGTGFSLRFYADADGVPEADPFTEILLPDDTCGEDLAPGGDHSTQFIYEHCVEVPLEPGHYWFSVQMVDHGFPPQWGRLGADMTQIYDSCFRCEYFSYTEWVPFAGAIGSDYDASQMLEDECIPHPTKTASWGAIKGLYH